MADFQIAHSITAGNEGGYANHKADSGGQTYAGISRKWWKNWYGWPLVDAAIKKHGTNIDAINSELRANLALQNEVKVFYKVNFWDACKLDSVTNQDLANTVYDMAVNAGTRKAISLLQEAINLCSNNGARYRKISVDGLIGPGTLGAVNSNPRPGLVLKVFNSLRGEHYINLMRKDPTQEVFCNSWFSRI